MKKLISTIIHKKLAQNILLSFFQSSIVRNRIIKRYMKEFEEPKLQIGFGSNYINGWLNTGISLGECKKGMYLDAGKTFPFPNDSFEYVFSEHLFEHLTYPQAQNMLNECFRVLKPGGVMRLATPNLLFLFGLYQNPEKPIHREYIDYSAKDGGIPPTPVYVINRFHTAWGHQIIYDKETLTDLLQQKGFKSICQCEVGQSSHQSLQNVEGHFHYLPFEYNRLETMIFEATK